METGEREALPCIVCGCVLKQAVPAYEDGRWLNQPADGVTCRTFGNYGSRVFDSIDPESHLTFSVCDGCLTAAGVEGKVREHRRWKKYGRWDPTALE